jgi:predicted RNA-binding Zn ribbon-like protein
VGSALRGRLDPERAAVYFQIVYDALREPMQRALEAKIMERQTAAKAALPPFVQRLVEGGFRDGRLEGLRDGRLEGLREALLRLTARAGIALSEDDRARIRLCDDVATLDRWVENVIGAATAADVFE